MGASGALRMKRPVATAWVTAANIGSTGTGVVESTAIFLGLNALPAFYQATIEVQFTQIRNAGTGSCYGWVRVRDMQMSETVADNTRASDLFTGWQGAAQFSRTRRVLINPLVLSNDGVASAGDDRIQLHVKGRGSAADTEWAISGIRARIIYVPL